MGMERRLRVLFPGLLLIAALLTLALARTMVGTARDGLTLDEPYHYAAGVSYARLGDYRINPEHPPLAKLWTGWLTPSSVVLPPLRELHEKDDERIYTQSMAYLDNAPADTQHHIRVAMFALNLLLLAALALLVWKVAGLWWAAGLLAWLAVDPTVGAHLPVLMTDLPVALALGLSAASAAWLASTWRWPAWVAFALSAGLALGSKHSAPGALAGIGVALLLAAAWRHWRSRRDALPGAHERGATLLARWAAVALAALVAVAVLWSFYGFRFHAGRDGSDAFNRPTAPKIDDLASPMQRRVLHALDDARLLPRAYLWGMADTLRAGVEGRGQREHKLFGRDFKGAPPWFFWPGALAAKIPLPLLAGALLGLLALWRAPLSSGQKHLLLTMGALGAAYWASLLGSRGTYAGVRHALPLFLPLATLAGALAWRASVSLRRRWLLPLAFAPTALALVMTAREPRLWEYFNELGGGSANGWRNFADEGVDLGQRLPEISRWMQAHQPPGTTLYNSYMYMPEWVRGSGSPLREYVGGVDDTNVAGHYAGLFVMRLSSTIPEPEYNWNPAVTMRNLHQVGRIGVLGIWQGRMDDKRLRVRGLYREVLKEVYRTPAPDWRQVARRCAEILEAVPFATGCYVERGNALARLGDVAGARKAWTGGAEQLSPDDPIGLQLRALVKASAGDRLPADWRPVRNPSLE